MNKSELRKELIKIRSKISERAIKSEMICEKLSEFVSEVDSVFVYVSVGTEADTRNFIERLLPHKRVFVPYTGHDKTMHAVRPKLPINFSAVDACGNAPSYTDKYFDGQADVTVVPLLGFDRSLHRIGYGAGCYDRYFAANPSGLKVGLAFCEQQCEFAAENNDVPLDVIITPKGIVRRQDD